MKNRKFILASLILAAASFANRDHAAAAKALKAATEDEDFENVAEEILEEQARLALAGDDLPDADMLDNDGEAEEADADEGDDGEDDEDEDEASPEEVLSKFVAGRDAKAAALAKAKAKAEKAKAEKAKAAKASSEDEDDEDGDAEEDTDLQELTASLRKAAKAPGKPQLSERAKANLAALRRDK